MRLPVVRFEVRLQECQRIDPGSATFAYARPLLGIPDGNFFEHGRNQCFHQRLLRLRDVRPLSNAGAIRILSGETAVISRAYGNSEVLLGALMRFENRGPSNEICSTPAKFVRRTSFESSQSPSISRNWSGSASRLTSELAVRCGFGIYANVLVLASLFNKEPL